VVPGKTTPLYLIYDGSALDGPLYRIVKECPPTLDDFCSYEALAIPYSKRRFFLATGVSLLTTRRAAVRLARRHDLGKAIAVVDLRVEGVIWTKSGGPGHLTVWAPPELLLERVLQCEPYE
jgi:hypothetical protein